VGIRSNTLGTLIYVQWSRECSNRARTRRRRKPQASGAESPAAAGQKRNSGPRKGVPLEYEANFPSVREKSVSPARTRPRGSVKPREAARIFKATTALQGKIARGPAERNELTEVEKLLGWATRERASERGVRRPPGPRFFDSRCPRPRCKVPSLRLRE